MESSLVDTSRISLKELKDKSVAKKMIEENHYSHRFSKCTFALGVYYLTDTPHLFLDEHVENLIGCVCFGDPVGSNVAASISPNVKQGEIWELTRLWIADGYGKNIESYSIGCSFDYIRKYHPKIKVIISYADPAAGHNGKIYQATNFLYCPTGQIAGDYLVSFDNVEWAHVRTLENTYGGLGLENMKDKLPKPFWVKKNSTKVRYIKVIANKKEKRLIESTLKYPPQPYLKSTKDTGGEILFIE